MTITETCLVHTDGLAPELDLVHDLASIFGVLLCQKLAKAVPLVCHGYTVFREMDVY
jgi:hypothetical protein